LSDQIRRKPPPNVPWPIGPTVLVTGASGGIGSNLVNRLLNDKSVRVIFAVDLKISKVSEKNDCYNFF
jgi:NAD(P)-dependent dehydrogenase (short-subunit alcohol dehydrogenase family)